MAPTLALDEQGPVLAVGAAGGTRLRSALIQVLTGILDEGLDPQSAVERPRLHPVGEVIHVEPGFETSALEALEATGGARPALARPPPLFRRCQCEWASGPGGRPPSERLVASSVVELLSESDHPTYPQCGHPGLSGRCHAPPASNRSPRRQDTAPSRPGRSRPQAHHRRVPGNCTGSLTNLYTGGETARACSVSRAICSTRSASLSNARSSRRRSQSSRRRRVP